MRLFSEFFTLPNLVYRDRKTDLMWTRNANIAGVRMTWPAAVQWVSSLHCGGYSDWRLPNIEELWFFLQDKPADKLAWFQHNGFLNVETGSYWSSDTHPYYSHCALSISTSGYKSCDEFGDKERTCCFVWPVRFR